MGLGVLPPKSVAPKWGSDEAGGLEGAGSWSGDEDSESSDSDEGRWENPRDSRGSSSMKRESKTSFHDGVLEVVAVEGVLHLGQIQVSQRVGGRCGFCVRTRAAHTARVPVLPFSVLFGLGVCCRCC